MKTMKLRQADQAAGRDPVLLRLVSVLALALLAAIAAGTGSLRGAEHGLNELVFTLAERPASGQVQVVEMDAASIAAIQRWPWTRDHYARMVERLDAAGVRSITFDVDFSSHSDPREDAAFGAAIAAATAPVALPTFAQHAGFREGRQLDSLPIAPLRAHAHLASVAIIPDEDGFVRRMPLGTVTGKTARPSIAAFVAGRAGRVSESFPIDFAIAPATIPRHSFIAIERGEFDADALKGRDIIIGATAIELGDRYPVPRYGVIPGVIVQALAAETLLEAVPVYGSWPAPLLLSALLALIIMSAHRRRSVVLRGAFSLAVLAGVSAAAHIMAHTWFEIVPAFALLVLAALLRLAILTHRIAEQQRRTDPESGLPNKLALDRNALPGERGYFVAAQLDDFDALKLAAGPDNIGELLRRLVERLTASGCAVTIYRIDARALVWWTPLELVELEPVLAGLAAIMRSPFEVAGRRLGVSVSLGVAPADAPGSAANAVHAASLARRSGKPWRLYAAAEETAMTEQFSLLGELDEALVNGQITVHYQPKLNLARNRIDAAEALVRWHHPERGLLPPDSFIPLIEEAGRIDDLTLAVLAQAIKDMHAWCEQGLVIGVAVNVSATLLGSERFFAEAQALVTQSGVPAGLLTFEVTESAQFEDIDRAIAVLGKFRASGIRISMDDYGTGQSTLNYLKLLPLSELKIDRMFIQHAHRDHGDAMLVRSTVQLAHELGLKVVAEGIEDAECLAFLKAIACDYGQGYFIGRALDPRAFAEHIAAPQVLAA
jgi:EAL domain-containing protein (putative c-di-GMP-specific phosphodiesterase class I)/CHASE2 domain-containing sensor protein